MNRQAGNLLDRENERLYAGYFCLFVRLFFFNASYRHTTMKHQKKNILFKYFQEPEILLQKYPQNGLYVNHNENVL